VPVLSNSSFPHRCPFGIFPPCGRMIPRSAQINDARGLRLFFHFFCLFSICRDRIDLSRPPHDASSVPLLSQDAPSFFLVPRVPSVMRDNNDAADSQIPFLNSLDSFPLNSFRYWATLSFLFHVWTLSLGMILGLDPSPPLGRAALISPTPLLL